MFYQSRSYFCVDHQIGCLVGFRSLQNMYMIFKKPVYRDIWITLLNKNPDLPLMEHVQI